jgi:hypothetical protein
MMPVECNLRLFDELGRLVGTPDLLVPTAVRAELRKLADGAGEEATAARVGLDLLDRCELRETDADYADDAVLELAGEAGDYAVTNDEPLRERLLAAGVPVISLRAKNKLAITQP